MRVMAQCIQRASVVVVLSLSVLVFTNLAGAADQAAKPPTKKVVKAKTGSQEKPRAAKQAGPFAAAISEDVALATFDAFTIEWMKKLDETEAFHKAKAQVVQSSDGFSVEYVGYLPHRYIHVKKTESTDTPYVGILTYYEKKLRCSGKTQEEARQGPFDQVETNQVSEIFRFTKGKWVY